MTNRFAELLLADGPSVDAADAELFGQFVGSWDIAVTWFEDRSPIRHERGEWHIAWVLGGRAIQDVWVVPPLAEQKRGAPVYEYGTTLRFPDPSGSFWHSTWHGPVNGLVACFTARREASDVVLMGRHPDGRRLRWTFSDIEPDRFSWRNESNADDGPNWVLVQSFTAVRQT